MHTPQSCHVTPFVNRLAASFLLFAAMIVSVSGASGDETTEFSDEDLTFFEKRVRPILVERCFECHSGESQKTKGGLRLDRRDEILRGGDSGPAVLPGKSDDSLLIRVLRHDGDIQMPPNGKIPDHEIAILVEWVQKRLPFPQPRDPSIPDKSISKNIDWEARKSHWAFQPLRSEEPAPIPAPLSAWVESRLDAWVSREWTRHSVSTAGQANRSTLLRRVGFDVTGLAPSYDEFNDFEADTLPDAYDRLVDRQLASIHHGERWGRYWLDLARYCDSPESWRESNAKAWLYRDWVVSAINRDLPFDSFVRQQFAADLEPDADPRNNAALGFLGLSPSYWKELKLDQLVIKQVVAEEWEERIEAIGATFLGLTVACARCHDHKYDPISTHDYYGLAGVLASLRFDDRPTVPEAEAKIAREANDKAKKLQEELDKLLPQKPLTEELQKQIDEKQAALALLRQTPFFDAPWVYGVSEASLHVLPDGPNRTKLEYREREPQDVAIQIRGNPGNLGPVIPRRFLSMLQFQPGDRTVDAASLATFRQGSGRLELANALVTQAAPLTARVIVNRIWRQHFGRGLVATPSNFGLQGQPPSHPELLDELARRFITQGWSMKKLHREMLLSATYRQASHLPPLSDSQSIMDKGMGRDPDNLWLWRSPVRRLDLEAWRDSILAASGRIDLRVGGAPASLADAQNVRRTIYGQVKRRELTDLQRLHDFPDPVSHVAAREPTTTPLQQLFALNGPLLEQQSLALAETLRTQMPDRIGEQVRAAYQRILGREPAPEEHQSALDFVTAGDPELLRQFIHALLASNEFQFVD